MWRQKTQATEGRLQRETSRDYEKTDGRERPSSCLTVRVIYVRLVK
jgi:hypothetical protein